MRKWLWSVVMVALVAMGGAWADCTCPNPPCEVQYCPSGTQHEAYIGVEVDGVLYNLNTWIPVPGSSPTKYMRFNIGNVLDNNLEIGVELDGFDGTEDLLIGSSEYTLSGNDWVYDKTWVELEDAIVTYQEGDPIGQTSMSPTACAQEESDLNCALNQGSQLCSLGDCTLTKWCDPPGDGQPSYCMIYNSYCKLEGANLDCSCHEPNMLCYHQALTGMSWVFTLADCMWHKASYNRCIVNIAEEGEVYW